MAWQRAGVGSWAELRIGSGSHALPCLESTTLPWPRPGRLSSLLAGALKEEGAHAPPAVADTNRGGRLDHGQSPLPPADHEPFR